MATVVQREWLNWDQPCLQHAARWMVDRFGRDASSESVLSVGGAQARSKGRQAAGKSKCANAATLGGTLWDVAGAGDDGGDDPPAHALGDVCDLQHVICVLPGRRAGRLLLGELLRECDRYGCRLVPPRVLTPGAMVDELLEAAEPVATPLEAKLAWLAALRASSDDDLRPVLPQPPSREGDQAPWLELAAKIASLHDELAGENRSFADVADAAERREMFGEGDRWRALSELHKKQRRALGEARLVDANDARTTAIAGRRTLAPSPSPSQESEGDGRVVLLVGVTDLNAQQRLALQASDANVIALMHAPSELSDAFDDLGTVRIDAWADRRIAIDDDQIVVAERPVDQAQHAMRAIARLAGAGECSASHITLGVGDAALAGDLEVAAAWTGLSLHAAGGESLSRSAPARLLLAVADFIEDSRFEHFATLLRHPDLERAVVRSTSDEIARQEWLGLLDEYFADHLQGAADGAWLGNEERQSRLKALWQAVQRILQPLLSGRVGIAHRERRAASDSSVGDAHSMGGPRPLHEWCQSALDVLANVYAIDAEPAAEIAKDEAGADKKRRALPPADLRAIDACLELRNVIAEIAFAAPSLQPEVAAVGALRIMLDHARAAVLSEDLEPNQIEMLGWLELHLDPAPMLIIAGVNDGKVPETLTADAFLPDSLRQQLGLMHNARRYARDAYLLQAIIESHAHVRLIVGRRDALNEPLTPSRLLLACDDATLVQRVSMFARDLANRPSPPPIGLRTIDDSRLTIDDSSRDADRATNPQSSIVNRQSSIRSRFIVPRLQPPLEAPAAMRVTDFRNYLRCPYRWALERVLSLKPFGVDEAELNPLSFGSLVHDVLSALGEDERMASSDDPDAIFRFLSDHLHRLVDQRHGAPAPPAIMIQRARIEQRLRTFAEFQAQAARDGWRIRHCEIDIKERVALDIPGADPMPLRGTIDRIDENIRTGQWRVIDYKTGEAGKSPIRMHHGSNDLPAFGADLVWQDLQLPLYYLLATRDESLRLPADRIALGYVVLPRRADGVTWLGADWTIQHLEHGIERARSIVREIREAVKTANFERNREIDSPFDTFARICQTAAFQPSVSDDSGEGEIAIAMGGGDE